MIRFELLKTDGHARRGLLHTNHGVLPTPLFMPVGTAASVKALDSADVEATGARMLIMNTYHLWLRPGPEVVRLHGGLHGFSRWPHAIATDSGGFQAFSLAERVKLSEEGFEFSSHLDGTRLHLSPEVSMQVQAALGSDIAMQLDVCPPGQAPDAEMAEAVLRTTRWAKRCLAARDPEQALFGIIQGGTNVERRLAHARELSALPFDGLALGGFSVGEPNESMHATLRKVAPLLDPARPHYLMGVGTPADLLRAIAQGIDIFDCVMPTRNARNGQVFTPDGKIVIKHAKHRYDLAPLDESCPCSTCRSGLSRSYLRHLFIAGELSVYRYLSLHNLTFYARLVQQAREAIELGRFADFAQDALAKMAPAT